MHRLTLALAAALLPTFAAADAKSVLAAGEKLCTAQNGSFGSDGAVKPVDLTGDGKPDTVVDEALFTCSTAKDLFGGPQGATVHFIADGGETARRVLGWDTAKWNNVMVVLLSLPGSACGGGDAQPCVEALTWGGSGFLGVGAKQP